MPNQAWEDAIPLMQQQLDLILVEGDKSVVPDGVRDYFKKIQAEGWDNNRLVLTYGRLDVDRLIPLCREGIVPWWVPLTGKALDNALEDLQKLSAAFKEDVGNKDVSNIYTALLTWLAYPDVMKVQGYPRKFNADIVRHVLQQGADPNNDNGSWLMRALNQLPADCISPFIEYGAAPAAVQEAMETMEQQKKSVQLAVVKKVVAGKTLYAKVDDETLMAVKFIPEGSGLAIFRSIFNFHARRVNEVFENGSKAAMSNAPFSEYSPEAIGFAAQKLETLGGKPHCSLDKPRLPQLNPKI